MSLECIDSAAASRRHHLRGSIYSGDDCSCCRQTCRELPITAAEVQNPFAWLRSKPLYYAARKLMHKCAYSSASLFRIPVLRHG